MRKLWLGILATLLVVVFVAPSFAWEFSMTGEFEVRYRYFGRADGSKDLFGDMNFQNSGLNTTGEIIGFAGPNFYRGFNGGTIAAPAAMPTGSRGTNVRIVKGGWSAAESDAFTNDQRMTFAPTIRINNAIRLTSQMDLAGIQQKYNHRDVITNGPLNRWYQDRVSENAYDTAMIPSINQFRVVAQLPWGTLSYGLTKDFPFGTGAVLGVNTRASALLVVVPYGPFRFLPGIWLARNTDGYGNLTPYTSPMLPATTAAAVNYDSGLKNRLYWAPAMTYSNGPLELGAAMFHQLLHYDSAYTGPVGRTTFDNGQFGTATPWTYRGSDTVLTIYAAYMKYNNGRFFANAEYGFGSVDSTFLGSSPGFGANTGAPQLSTERSYAFAEGGALVGPAKLGLMFAWTPGNVLNNANNTKAYGGIAINYVATDAYNYLMFHTYGGGNDAPWTGAGLSFTIDENGQMADAYALGGRFDYAVAANLNFWGSYMWAHRVEQNGYYAGGKNSSGVAGNTTAVAAQIWKANAIGGAIGAGGVNPYVDNGFIGWEANLGADWKLLENLKVTSRYAYWHPGEWFDQAYQVLGTLPGGAASNAAAMTGRSAIQAFEASVVVDF